MANWRSWGPDRRVEFEKELSAPELEHELRYYQNYLSGEFGVRELLMLKDIEAKARIAEAINDLPEFLLDQIGIAINERLFVPAGNAIGELSEVLDEKLGGEDG